MPLQALTSPEVYFGAALVIFLALLIASMVLSTRPDARMEFLLGLMKDFPKEGKNGSGGWQLGVEEGKEEEPPHPAPRNSDSWFLSPSGLWRAIRWRLFL
jgi:hypothetical protein